MDCMQRQEASRKYAAEKISEIFPDVIALAEKKDKFSEVSHGLAVSSLAHGFSGGILFSEDYPEPVEDYTDVALTYAYRYAIRSGARGDDKENVVKGFFNGFKAGVKYGLQTQI